MRILAETPAHEGPVHVASEDALYFTTVPDRSGQSGRPVVDIRRLDLADGAVTTVRADANAANGMALAPDGRLVVCEQGSLEAPARISLVDRRTGAAETLVDAFEGRPLNSPNDVVVARDGAVWFTDPGYGHLQGFRPAPEIPQAVYRLDPRGGRLELMADGFDKPNGLAFSPTGDVLYVGDNGAPHHLLALPVGEGERLGRPRVVAVSTPGHPDGIKVDAGGRVYATVATGVRIYDPGGDTLGEIPLPGAVNFALAGDTVLITADTAIWAAPAREGAESLWQSYAHAG